MKSTFRRNPNTLRFNSPRWQNVNAALYNPAKWAKFRIKNFRELLQRFKKK